MSSIAKTPLSWMPAELIEELDDSGIGANLAYEAVVRAIAEDLPSLQGPSALGEDVTSVATIPFTDVSTGDFEARGSGVLCGVALVELTMRYVVSPDVSVQRLVGDGEPVSRGDRLISASGPTGLLLTAERTALNFLCHLSGVATATAAWSEALAGTKARVRDTRKTIPGFRAMDKYAVRCGGGINHRMSLSDQALIKDNHVLAAGGVVQAYQAVRRAYPELPVQVEVTTLEQLVQVVEAGATEVMLDNMDVEMMRRAVELNAGRARLEASGGLSVDVAQRVAQTGVDYLAVGALTHSAAVLDIAMDLRPDLMTEPSFAQGLA